jgi:uncharacterized surface protein with fasciclin (FAS1) repeats
MSRQNPKIRRRLSAATAALLLTAAACGSDDTADDLDIDATDVENVVDSVVDQVETAPDDLAQTLRDNGLDTIAGVVEQIDLSELLDDEDFTFFAPNDEAFTTLGADQTADLLTDPAQVVDVLRNHTLAERVSADELTSAGTVTTEAGESLEVTTDGSSVTLGEVTVVSTDIDAGGGVIHVVDGFLIP